MFQAHFDRSQDVVQLFEKHFPPLRTVEFDVFVHQQRLATVGRAALRPGDSLIALRHADTRDGDAEAPYFAAYSQMKDPESGVEVRDRRWLLRTYHDCFTGQSLCSTALYFFFRSKESVYFKFLNFNLTFCF